jgi:hypothetical protein
MKHTFFTSLNIVLSLILVFSCGPVTNSGGEYITMSQEDLKDKIMGAWALQTIGVTYGGPTEFRYLKKIIPDSIDIVWNDTLMYHWMTRIPGLYDDIYMYLTFVEVFEKEGLDAPASAHGKAYANAEYWLWHANQQGRYNILNGIDPPESGHWLNNPHADDIDFQIEADFAGIMAPGMPNAASAICDPIGHIMNSGNGYYGGVYMAAMYSNAYVMDDIHEVVEKSLAVIPVKSSYYKCMRDVIDWSKQYPMDWKKTWELVEEKWGEDIGCPDGVHADFNIDATINSAYVIMGLLYGNGDLDKTMEISTRCGQDSDCNPASAGGILGAMIGYRAIPEKWANGLEMIEDLDFKYTTISLNDAYGLSFRHALEVIKRNGGEVTDDEVKIKVVEPVAVPFEENFPGYKVAEIQKNDDSFMTTEKQELKFEFEGIGFVLRGRVLNKNFKNRYALEGEEPTINNYKIETEFYIDGDLVASPIQPLAFQERNHELFYKYELPEGKHELVMKIINPHPDVIMHVGDLITYTK